MILGARALLALAVLPVTAPAFADAVTYQGTLGKTAIVSSSPAAPPIFPVF